MSSVLTAKNQNTIVSNKFPPLVNQLLMVNKVPSHKTTKFEQTAEKTLYNKVLIICGPTATGKTKFGIDMAKKFDGEIVSADSRQVYTGKNLVHGKDLPVNLKPQVSNLKWRKHRLKYYEIEGVKIWLYDVVEPGEEFSVTLWLECAQILIEDILSRQKLPIVVGGAGLYLKSLFQSLSQISIPPNPELRHQLETKSPAYLFDYLSKLDKERAKRMNNSDRQNPRRLIRAVEISQFQKDTPKKDYPCSQARIILNVLQIGLTASREELFHRVDKRVEERIAAGSAEEDPILSADPNKWKQMEHQIAGQQLTWFKKQPDIEWFDITQPSWEHTAEKLIKNWYNSPHAAKD